MSVLRIGLTGGIASGKSKVSHLFSQKSIPIIDADTIARDLFKPKASLLKNLKEKFGESIFYANGELDRKALGKLVFNSPNDLKWLNQLTHPKISAEIKRQLSRIKSGYVILDIPLLINPSGTIPSHLKEHIDRILVITIEPEVQLQRLLSREQLSLTDAQSVINNQSSLDQKLQFADDLIDNNGNLKMLESQVDMLDNKYTKLSTRNSGD